MPDTTAAAALASLSFFHPELAPAFATAQPVLTVLTRCLAGVGPRKAGAVVVQAAELGDEDVRDFAERLIADPETIEVFARAVDVALRSTRADKLRALSHALRTAADDHAKIDEELVFMGAIEPLEAPHIKVLEDFTRNSAGTVLAPNAEPEDFPGPIQRNRAQVAMLRPELDVARDAVLGVLVAGGLLESWGAGSSGIAFGMMASGGPSTPTYQITPLGTLVLKRLQVEAVD